MSKRIKNSLEKLDLSNEVNQAILRLVEDPYLYYEEESQAVIKRLEDLSGYYIKSGKQLESKSISRILSYIFSKKTKVSLARRPDILLFIIDRYLTIINKHWKRKSYKGKSHEKEGHIKAAFEEIFPQLEYPEKSKPKKFKFKKSKSKTPGSKFDTRSKLNTALSFFCYRNVLRFDDIKKIYSKWKKPKESAKYIDFEYDKLSYRRANTKGVSYIRTLDPIEKIKFVETKRNTIQKPYIEIIDPDERKKYLEMKRNTKRITLEIRIKKDLIKT